MSAEAAVLADKLPEALPLLGGVNASKGAIMGVDGIGSMSHGGKGTGVDTVRRADIREFLTRRFKNSQDTQEKVRPCDRDRVCLCIQSGYA